MTTMQNHKVEVWILSILVFLFGASGLYAGFNHHGYLAFLLGVFCGKASTRLYTTIKKAGELKLVQAK
ncbi:hypothetical protein C8N47_12316 [Mangrovibacterium marinum]|uniref:Uncharacterized protein n=1 Tax=Mangrovibacterium marinum TaxID=1639118 RepID=A0A2T5BY06_9BACT|nr:hypothetical protein C8N47_12316 [Mangrovibacterium marinum]